MSESAPKRKSTTNFRASRTSGTYLVKLPGIPLRIGRLAPHCSRSGCSQMSTWLIALLVYLFVTFLTLVPVVRAWLVPVTLNPGGPGFDEATNFSEPARLRLSQNYERIKGTLAFWKHEATKYERTH